MYPDKIVLIGFMGSGKTTFGRSLAQKLEYRFIDLDDWIEDHEEKTISEIFAQNGESYFRKCEQQALIDVLGLKKIVCATGGGAPCFDGNMEIIRKNAFSVYLETPQDILFGRLRKLKSERPLIADLKDEELREKIRMMMADREKYYLKADLVYPGNNVRIDELKKSIKQHFSLTN